MRKWSRTSDLSFLSLLARLAWHRNAGACTKSVQVQRGASSSSVGAAGAAGAAGAVGAGVRRL